MDNLIDQIHHDHISMAKVLNLMDKEIQKILTDGEPDYDLLVDGMRYMVSYSDTVHHPKEDAIFRCLSQRDNKLKSIIVELQQQHHELAEMGAQLFNAVKNAALGEFVSKDQIASSGTKYIETLRQHMDLEEGEMLSGAREWLSEEDMTKVAKQYATFRDPLLSDSLEQEYQMLYQGLMH